MAVDFLQAATSDDEAWARTMRKIAANPRKGRHRLLVGDAGMTARLAAATATTPISPSSPAS